MLAATSRVCQLAPATTLYKGTRSIHAYTRAISLLKDTLVSWSGSSGSDSAAQESAGGRTAAESQRPKRTRRQCENDDEGANRRRRGSLKSSDTKLKIKQFIMDIMKVFHYSLGYLSSSAGTCCTYFASHEIVVTEERKTRRCVADVNRVGSRLHLPPRFLLSR